MEGTYPVSYRGEKVGTASLRRRGLYYEIDCRCRMAGGEMVQLILIDGKRMEDLGLLIPNNGSLELRKRIPTKQIGEVRPEFCLRCRTGEKAVFFAIDPQRPFPSLHRLTECVFHIKGEEKGIILPDENNGEKVEI